ncbi:MAG: hypothetical protein JNN07_19155 [Verrucomicrobiales bacterium]|nr:hypothetical protein [Verrucomicrobiales bacterium]
MNKHLSWVLLLSLSGSAPIASAQSQDELQRLRQQLEKMQSEFERQQQLQREQIDALKRQIEALGSKPALPASVSPPANSTSQPKPATPASEAPAPQSAPWKPSDPIRLQKGNAYLDLGLVGTMAVGGSTADDIEGGLQLGAHDPRVRGFTLQGLEASFTGAVDPYFRAASGILFQIDSEGESSLEVEEAYLETLSLPANLTLRAGQFFSEFGRHNSTHPHTWTSVDSPLVSGRFLGGDGLRNLGAKLSWLAPTPFFTELSLGVQNSHGETAASFRNSFEGEAYFHRLHDPGSLSTIGDLLFTPRLASSFNLTDQQTLLVGLSGAFGPNASGRDTDTQIYGADMYWKWKPADANGGFPFVSWQSEIMLRRYQAGAFDWDLDGDSALNPDGSELDGNSDGTPDLLSRETLTDYGFYTQIAYGFRRGWVAALRGDYVDRKHLALYESLYGSDQEREGRWRIAPNLTWYPSEYSKIRLQYNYDQRRDIGTDHSVWMQFEFSLGAHPAHKF